METRATQGICREELKSFLKLDLALEGEITGSNHTVFYYQSATGGYNRRVFIKFLGLSKLSGLFAELNLKPGEAHGFLI